MIWLKEHNARTWEFMRLAVRYEVVDFESKAQAQAQSQPQLILSGTGVQDPAILESYPAPTLLLLLHKKREEIYYLMRQSLLK